jgi:hypothetical protein
MPNIHLADAELKMTIELLEREAAELHEEIHRTDKHEYRDQLKADEGILREVLRKLKEAK